jgi:hypothetical protein
LNPHDFLGSQDFKSCASAISPHRQAFISRVFNRSLEIERSRLCLRFRKPTVMTGNHVTDTLK